MNHNNSPLEAFLPIAIDNQFEILYVYKVQEGYCMISYFAPRIGIHALAPLLEGHDNVQPGM
jgi:hypothetical protein